MILITSFYIFGLILQYYLYKGYQFILIGIAVMTMIGILFRQYLKTGIWGFLLVIALLGTIQFKIHYEDEGMLGIFENQNITMIGDVIARTEGEKTQYTILAHEIIFQKKRAAVKEKVLLQLQNSGDKPNIEVGQRIYAEGLLIAPDKSRNPNTFDYNMYLKAKNIHRVMYIKPHQITLAGKGNISFLISATETIKNTIERKIRALFPGVEGNVLLAVLLGEKGSVDDNQMIKFRGIGIAHVFAVSGLHVGIIYLGLERLLLKINFKMRLGAVVLILWIYAGVTGFSSSVMRAALLLTLMVFAPLLNRRYDSLSAIAVAAFLFLLPNPLLLLNVGFQLSFSAALSIALLYKPIKAKLVALPPYVAQLMAASLAAQLGTVPIIAYHFNIFSPIALLINVPIVFLIGYIVPLGFIAVFSSYFSVTVAKLFARMIYILLLGVDFLSIWAYDLPYSNIKVISPSLFMIFIYYIFLGILIQKKEWHIKATKVKKEKILMVLAAIGISVYFMHNVFFYKHEIIFLDVGQGDCTLIKTPERKTILIDGGNRSSDNNGKNSTLVSFLLKNRIGKIDVMILSHPHGDHMGGLMEVAENLVVENLFVSMDAEKREEWGSMEKICANKRIPVFQVTKGDRIEVGKEVIIYILSPDKELIKGSRDDANNNSLVLLVAYLKRKILFTGDIEKEAEEQLVREYSPMDIDLLKIAHHGSRFSTTEEFLDVFLPKIAVIQVGRNNFGHPHQQVLDKLSHRNISVYRNDRNGAVRITFNRDKIRVNTMLLHREDFFH
ncbi:MAG: DNA internalization-related competence protein ComEC/Rec2 [Thermotaleaceae bacterium]